MGCFYLIADLAFLIGGAFLFFSAQDSMTEVYGTILMVIGYLGLRIDGKGE